jgi:hypothetical protein
MNDEIISINILVFPCLFVTLASPKLLPFEKTQIKFGFLLTYS